MKVTFIGTGDAGGTPLYGCDCVACERARSNPELRRSTSCVLVESGETQVMIDAGVNDFCERFPAGSLDAVLLTHYHLDHVFGLFRARWGTGHKLKVFGPPDSQGCDDLYKHPGILDIKALDGSRIEIGSLAIQPVVLAHSKPTLGYLLSSGESRFAYLTDTCGLPPATLESLRAFKPQAAAIDCTHPPRVPEPGALRGNHNDVTLALECLDGFKPGRAFLTHLSHHFERWHMENPAALPANVTAARDGMEYKVANRPLEAP